MIERSSLRLASSPSWRPLGKRARVPKPGSVFVARFLSEFNAPSLARQALDNRCELDPPDDDDDAKQSSPPPGTMERPAGPRQPDKRNEAYESIFGRPSATHHQAAAGPYYGQSVQNAPYHPPVNQFSPPYNYYPQAIDRRTSHPSGNVPYYQHLPTYSQSPASQPHLPASSHYQHPHPHPQRPRTLAPPTLHARAPSVLSVPTTSATIPPKPEDPPDAALEILSRSGLTPAQAYQAQVYRTDPPPQNGTPSRPPDNVPRLGLIDPDIGSLTIDFASDEHATDDPDSELPWAHTSEHTRGLLCSISGRRAAQCANSVPSF